MKRCSKWLLTIMGLSLVSGALFAGGNRGGVQEEN
jgi:hypothetical protein